MTARAERFVGKTVVVTGASRGLGRAMAIAFGAEGAFVQVCFRSRATEADETLASVIAAGGTGAVSQCDVRDREMVPRVFDAVMQSRGRIDVLVNNAAIAADGPFAMMPSDDFDTVIDTNLAGVFHCCRAAIRVMMTARSGAIVNVASLAGIHATPGQANYAASKGGVLALTYSLASEAAPFGVRVNAVVPGFTSSGMAQRLDRRVSERYLAHIPVGRFGRADEIAAAVAYLASDDASYVVGHALVVDGGMSL